MAKTSLIEDISKTTQEIAANTKRFGFGPKLPSKDKSSEHEEHIDGSFDEVVAMIAGSFAQLIFGQSGKTKYSDLANLIGNNATDTIFGNIKSIKDVVTGENSSSIEQFGIQFANGMSKSKDYFAKLETSIKNGIKTSFTDLEIIRQLNNVNENLSKEKSQKSNEDAMHEVIVKLQATNNLKELVDLLDKLSKTKINNQTLNSLQQLEKITSKNGELQKLFDNITELNVNAQKVANNTRNLSSIKNILELVTSKATIGIKDAIRFRRNMFLIRHFIVSGLSNTLQAIANIEIDTKQDQNLIVKLCKNFQEILNMLNSSTEFGFFKSIRIRLNLMNLRDIITNDFAATLNAIIEVLNSDNLAKLGQYAEKRLSAFKSFLDFLTKITSDEQFDIDDAQEKLQDIESLVKNELSSLMKSITNDLKVQKETDKFASIKFNLESIVDLNAILPKLMSLLSMTMKMQLMFSFTKELQSLANEINEIPNIALSKTQWNDLTNKHIGGLIAIGELIKNTDTKQYSESIIKNMIPYVNDIIKLFKDIEQFDELDIDINRLKEIDEYLKQFSKLSIDKLPKQANMLKLLDIENIINAFVKNFDGDSFAMNEHIDDFVQNLETIVLAFSREGLIGQHLDTIVQIAKNDISKLDNLSTYFDSLNKLAKKLAIIDKVTDKMSSDPKNTGLVKLANSLKTAIDKFNEINVNKSKIDGLNKYINALAKFVITGAMVLLFGALIMTVIPIANIGLFILTLGAFVFAMMKIYKFTKKEIKLSLTGAIAFSLLMIASAAILVFGSMIMQFIDPKALVIFAVVLAAFVGAMVFIYRFANKQIMLSLTGAIAFSLLMIASAEILIFGSMIMQFIDLEAIFKFVLTLGGFMLGLSLIFKLFLKQSKSALTGVRNFAILILATGMTLAIGAFIAQNVSWGNLFKFSAALALFMIMTVGTLLLFKGSIRLAQHTGKEFAKIIVMSAATMIVGGLLFTLFPGIKTGVVEFAIIHGIYMLMIVGSLRLLGRQSKNMLKTAAILLAITVLSAAPLIIAGMIMDKYPSMVYNVPIFTGFLILYIGAMGTAAWLLNKVNKEIVKGVVVIGLLVTVTVIATLAISLAAQMAEKYSWETLGKGILALIAGIGLIGLAYWAMGYAGFADAGIGLGLATLVLTAISGLTFLTVTALVYIANNMDKMKTANIEQFKAVIKEFGGLARTLVDEFGSLKMMMVLPIVSKSVTSLSFALSAIARSIEEYANLKVSIYEGTKVVGYRQLNETDFTDAANNVKEIITTLGYAVIDAYDKNPEIFETNLFGTSKFAKVTKGLKTLGPMLSSIATAVKDYANLKVAIYEGTKVVGYRQLKEPDFTNAAENVKKVITTLGEPIEAIANDESKFELYDSCAGFMGIGTSTSKFMKVIEGNIKLADLISKIGQAVKDMANFNMPEEFNNDGSVKKWKSLIDTDFTNAATNITTIITTIGKPIEEIAKDPDKMQLYEETSGFLGIGASKSKFMKVIEGNIKLADLISSIATGIQMFASMKMPTKFDDKGNPTEFTQLKETDITNAGAKIAKVLTAISNAIINTIKGNEAIFGDAKDLFGRTNPNPQASPAYRAALAIGEITKPLSTMSEILAMYSMGIFPYIETSMQDGKQTIKTTNIKFNYEHVKTNIKNVLLAIVQPLKDIIDDKSFVSIFAKRGSDKTLGALRAEQITQMANQITAITEEIKKLGDIAIQDSVSKLTEIKTTLSSMILEVANIAKIFCVPMTELTKLVSSESNSQEVIVNQTLGEYLKDAEDKQTITSTETGIKSLSTSIKAIFDEIKSLVDYYNSNKAYIELFVNGNMSNNIQLAIENISTIMLSLTETISTFASRQGIFLIDQEEFDKQFELIQTIIVKTSTLFALIDTLYKEYEAHIAPYGENSEFGGLYNVVNACRNAIGMLYDYVGNGTTPFDFGTPFAKFVKNVDNTVDISNLTIKLDQFNKTVHQLVEIINYSEETGLEGYEIIMKGLDGIMAKIAVLPKEDNFKSNVRQLEKYVNAVNRIDLSKVIALNNLGETLNVLATKMGNLDKLTETLANQIATVLDRLVKELKHAEKTIQDADKLQTKRHSLIKSAVNEVKGIMDQKMLVEIKQVKDETPLDINTGGGSGASDKGSTSAPTPGRDTSTDTGSSASSVISTQDRDSNVLNRGTAQSMPKSEPVRQRSGGGQSTYYGMDSTTLEMAIKNALRAYKNNTL